MIATLPTPFGRLRRALLCAMLGSVLSPIAQARGPGDFRGHRAAFHAQGDARGLRQMERAQRPPTARFQQPPAPERVQPKPAAAPDPVEPQGRPPAAAPAGPPPADPSSRPGRLTPDERRALRQQINEAGRDIYRPVRP